MFHIDVLGKPEKRKNETRKKGEKKERKKERKNAFLDLPGHLQQVCTRDNP